MRSIQDPTVASVFQTYPPKFRRKLMALRELILETAESIEGVGEIEETLKWGEPAYVTSQTKSGTTIRIHWKESTPNRYAIYFHCRTGLVDRFRTMFPNDFEFEGNRSIVFRADDEIPVKQLSFCIETALTYHQSKKSRRK